MKKSVTVEVAGQRFTLKTDAEDEYVRSLARYVSGKIEEVKRGARTVSTHSMVVLAALQIADDLFQARRSEQELRQKVREKSRTILEVLRKEALPERDRRSQR